MKSKPFVRWVGGKTSIAPAILSLLGRPASGGRYFEPFVGGGAVFFALRTAGFKGPAVLADLNQDLISLYSTIRGLVESLIQELEGVNRDKDEYLELRCMNPEYWNDFDRALRTYYLSRCSFNCLWRVNKKGRMNVPYSAKKSPLVDAEVLRAASKALTNTTIQCEDFTWTVNQCRQGDCVYIDSPYLGGFTDYTAEGWRHSDLRALEFYASLVAKHGARVVVSVPDDELHQDVFRRWLFVEIEAPRRVAANGNREPARELLAVLGLKHQP